MDRSLVVALFLVVWLVVMVGVTTAIAGSVAWVGWRLWTSPDRHALGALRRAPVARAAQLVPGAVAKIVGTVQPIEELEAPLSGMPCAWWRVGVERRERIGRDRGRRSGRMWRSRGSREAGGALRVDDGTGTLVTVDLQGALIRVGSRGWPADERHPGQREILVALGLAAEERPLPLRFHEAALPAGRRIAVLGQVDLRESADGIQVCLVAPPGGRVVVHAPGEPAV